MFSRAVFLFGAYSKHLCIPLFIAYWTVNILEHFHDGRAYGLTMVPWMMLHSSVRCLFAGFLV